MNFLGTQICHVLKSMSSKPNEVVSDSESVQSEVISTDRPNPKSSDLSQLFSDPSFASVLEEQIANALANHFTSLDKSTEIIPDPHSDSHLVSHSGNPALENSSIQGEARSLARNTTVSHAQASTSSAHTLSSPPDLQRVGSPPLLVMTLTDLTAQYNIPLLSWKPPM